MDGYQTTDYNWAMYELYKEFGLIMRMKVMMKIKETLK